MDPSKTGNLFAQDGDEFDRGDLMEPIKAVCKSLCKERLISIFLKQKVYWLYYYRPPGHNSVNEPYVFSYLLV